MTDVPRSAGLDSATQSGPAAVVRPLPNPGDLIADRFRILRVLGTGSSAVVMAAHDSHLDTDVALKIYLHPPRDERQLARLRREVQTARGTHPHAVTVFDLHATGNLEFLSMELVDGESLRRRIADRGPLEVDAAVDVARQIALALTWLHERRLVHRDVKPGNILLDRSGTAKLCDLGLVRPLEHGQTLTATDLVVGTPAYMAPEQATGGDLTPAADVYALGLVLFNALTGDVPLRGDTAVATLMRRQRERAPRLRHQRSECPRWLDRLVASMLDTEPAVRPSASEVASILARRRLPWRPRRRTVIGAAAALAVGLLAVWAGPQLQPSSQITRVTVANDRVAGFDERGRELWSVPIRGDVISEQYVDLDHDGTDEILITSTAHRESGARLATSPALQILAVDRNGRVVTDEDLTTLVDSWPFTYPKRLTAVVEALQIDDQGPLELVVMAHQINHYPSTVLIYWTERNLWQQLLTHNGWFYDAAADADADHPRLVFFGVNNHLELSSVIAEVALEIPDSTLRSLTRLPLESPERPRGGLGTSHTHWRTYTLVDHPDDTRRDLNVAAIDGGVGLTGWLGINALDDLGNPVPGPNAGQDLRALRSLMLSGFGRLLHPYDSFGGLTPDEVRTSVEDLERDLEPLTAEPAYRRMITVLAARSLARHSLIDEATDLLRHRVSDEGSECVQHRLAHLEAIRGDLTSALERTNALARLTDKSSIDYNAVRLGLAVSVQHRDADSFESYLRRLTGGRVDPSLIGAFEAAIRARARLWWDRLEPTDGSVRSFTYEPEGEAVSCLARWRLGQSSPEDIATMDTFIVSSPDGATPGRIARAAVLLSAGRATEALEAVNDVLSRTRLDARDDFEIAQWRRLAQAIRVLALDAAGRPDLAAEEACGLTAEVPGHLLPAMLIAPFVSDGC
jgi:tRNA A-37 threonylcarbamoyl transferase component Bud32